MANNVSSTNKLLFTNSFFLYLVLAILSIIFIFFAYSNLLLALFFVLFIAVVIVFYKKPDIGIYLIIISILGGQLLKINFGSGESGLLLSDLLIPFFLLTWVLRLIFKKDKIPSTIIGAALFLFLSVATLSLINGIGYFKPQEIIISALYLVRLVGYGLLFYAASTIFSDERRIYVIKIIFFISFILFALLGIIQVIYFPNLTEWAVKYGWDPHIGRLFSTFLDPNFAGAFLVVGFIFSVSIFTYAKTVESKIIIFLASIIELIAIILTYSRSTYLFLFIAFFVLSILRSKKLLFAGVAAIIILLIIFPRSVDRIQGGFSVDESAKLRFESWSNTMAITRDHPLLGVGYNSFRYAQNDYGFVKESDISRSAAGSDSSLLLLFATTGVTGLLIFFLFYLSALITTKKIYNFSLSLQKRAFALALFSILTGLVFHSIFVNSLLYPALMIPLFIILGVISAKTNKIES